MTNRTAFEGNKIIYRGGFGEDPPSVATVVNVAYRDGQRIYTLSDGHWCYQNQIDDVIRDSVLTCPPGTEWQWYRCQDCGSWKVQADRRTWWWLNTGKPDTESECGEDQSYYCTNCESDIVVSLEEWNRDNVLEEWAGDLAAHDAEAPWLKK